MNFFRPFPKLIDTSLQTGPQIVLSFVYSFAITFWNITGVILQGTSLKFFFFSRLNITHQRVESQIFFKAF